MKETKINKFWFQAFNPKKMLSDFPKKLRNAFFEATEK